MTQAGTRALQVELLGLAHRSAEWLRVKEDLQRAGDVLLPAPTSVVLQSVPPPAHPGQLSDLTSLCSPLSVYLSSHHWSCLHKPIVFAFLGPCPYFLFPGQGIVSPQ